MSAEGDAQIGANASMLLDEAEERIAALEVENSNLRFRLSMTELAEAERELARRAAKGT